MSDTAPAYITDLTLTHGRRSLSFSHGQPGLCYFGDARRGTIAYRDRLGVRIALGDSLCAPERDRALLAEFVDTKRMMLFAQVGDSTAEHLRALGLYVTPIGVDSEIDLARFHLNGKAMRDLRHFRNRAIAGGVEVREETDSATLRATLRPISRDWLKRKSWRGREQEFLVRPLSGRLESGTRVFVGRVNTVAVAFVVFDPMYRDGVCDGYTATILRSERNVPKGTLDFIVLSAMECFRAEGLRRLSLGVSPMHGMREIARVRGHGAAPLYWICRALYRMTWQPIVNLRGLSFHKSRYRATERPVYIATKGRVGIWEMIALLRACRIW